MALSARQRQIVLGAALAVTLGLAAWLSGEREEAPEEPGAAPPTRQLGPAQSGRVGALAEAPPAQGDAPPAGEIRDIFAAQTWQGQPAESGAPAETGGEPEMPPLPFTYFGKLITDGRVTVYLAGEQRYFAVRRGDVIERDWRVESIGPRTMVFRYLPLDKRTVLAIGRAQ